ncbi:OmpA family protein [Pseudoflavitalea sp. G-6-1-2]|uniref:OmpA family protein n=1 Tax=Pseudoflavitalea sp. G-6-1-2 TaxID=2728841 RepID=UPI00146A1ADF|nr:OmpA family protein [Pseudoflavitalea sp. G-6-1-2]NML22038.1 OmpA family protein [Pseudoflavitalea sp. G-6-1-2]
MIRRLLPFTALAVLCANVSTAQDRLPKKKGSLIGFSVNATDFATPNEIKATSFKDVWKKGDWYKFGKKDLGFSLMYWKGITNKIDFSGRYNGVFTEYSKNGSKNTYSNEFEASLHARPLNDNYTVVPFLTAGMGVGNYGNRWSPYAPLGLGAQVNLGGITYLFVQANYRLALNQKKHDDNLFWSVGFTENISKPKKTEPVKTVPIPVVEAPKDTDGDGVADKDDACPDQKGLAQFNGCPDTDGDGVADKDDKCPNVAGLARYNGCPIPDTDGDGVNDEEDKCPSVAGVARYNGCPIPDTDGDGVNDEEDKCPNLPGVKENNGCPVVKEEVVKRVNVAAGNIFFSTGTAKLLAKSNKGLDQVAAEMKKDADLKLSIEGHTDNTGSPKVNQPLSEKRAQAVLAYLKSKGVEENRITATGFGSDKPVADNKTAKGRTLNRRVELKLNY